MKRVRTTEDFIERAKQVHGDKYDYSFVDYVKSSQKVRIICPKHGEFQQTPNHHLRGCACPVCSLRQHGETFVERARAVHGDRYDYSKVDYVNNYTKVEIICKIHGSFWQKPQGHIISGQGCPKCAAEAGAKRRRGAGNPNYKGKAMQKIQNTCLERYGAKTWAESAVGRETLHNIIVNDDLQMRTKQICLERYGAPTWCQSEEGHKRLHEIMTSDEVVQRIRSGYINAYGVDHYMKTAEGREKARRNISSDTRREAIRNAFLEKYGVTNALLVPGICEKIKNTMLERYHVTSVCELPEFREKAWATKRRNGTFSTSKSEDSLYLMLCDVFGKEHVIRQYKDITRYPFHCDFYVTVLDLFIELNASWTHGGHWFDSENPSDLQQLFQWKDRALHRGSRYYKTAIYVWTEKDVLKRSVAEANHLNYLVFWDNDLTDARRWLSQFYPIVTY